MLHLATLLIVKKWHFTHPRLQLVMQQLWQQHRTYLTIIYMRTCKVLDSVSRYWSPWIIKTTLLPFDWLLMHKLIRCGFYQQTSKQQTNIQTHLLIHESELGFKGKINLANLTKIRPLWHGLILFRPWWSEARVTASEMSILRPKMETDCRIKL